MLVGFAFRRVRRGRSTSAPLHSLKRSPPSGLRGVRSLLALLLASLLLLASALLLGFLVLLLTPTG